MSGHSKWSTIKHKKAAVDKKRGKIFTRIAKEITIAASAGGGDPESNNALGLAIDNAKAANMPKDNIERAIKRGTGELEGGELFELMYEVYGPNGIGILIEVVTDNKNRAIADVRHVVNKNGGNMADSGSVAWQFTRKGYIAVDERAFSGRLIKRDANHTPRLILEALPVAAGVLVDSGTRSRSWSAHWRNSTRSVTRCARRTARCGRRSSRAAVTRRRSTRRRR